jgi:hypothetical protein
VHVAGQQGDRPRRGAAAALGHRRQQGAEPVEGAVEGGPVLQADQAAQPPRRPRDPAAPGAVAQRLAQRLQMVRAVRQREGQRGGHDQVVDTAGEVLVGPAPLVLGEHGAPARVEHPGVAGVDRHQPGPAQVAVVAGAPAALSPVGPAGMLAQHPGGVRHPLHLAVDRVGGQLLRCEVAEVLVQPVAGQPAGDALLPPRPRAHVRHPRGGDVPVVADLVVVEDHRRRHGRQQPADRRVAPRLPVQPRVLLEIGDLHPRWPRGSRLPRIKDLVDGPGESA